MNSRTVEFSDKVPTDAALERVASLLSQWSVVYLVLGRIKILGRRPFDDRVRTLQSSPLGMFFYNQRAIVFGLGGVFAGIVLVLTYRFPATVEMKHTAATLTAVWAAGVILTLLLHPSFTTKLDAWASAPKPSELPPMFDFYFPIDLLLLLVLALAGKLLNLPLDQFAFLLVANSVVYAAYLGGRGFKRFVTTVLLLAPIAWFLIFQSKDGPPEVSPWFHLMFRIGPMVGGWVMAILSVLVISMLRMAEYQTAQLHLKLLGTFEEILSRPQLGGPKSEIRQIRGDQYSGEEFDKQVTKVLDDLCSIGPPFWYRSACLWYLEAHQDHPKHLLVPGPRVRFPEGADKSGGIDASAGFLGLPYLGRPRLALLHSIKHRSEEWKGTQPEFRGDLDAPAAFVPLHRGDVKIGVLAIYGEQGGPPIQRQEEPFLRSLASIIADTMEQWEGRYREFPQTEMDDLFERSSLREVFEDAARILRSYLKAEGCMVLFRPDPSKLEMVIKAKDGFREAITKNHYVVGVGQTGKCAEEGRTIKWDDVSSHIDRFNRENLRRLARARGKAIRSWMAIPIGSAERGERNHGVIKVVNRTVRRNWFSEFDQRVGENLARRLHIIIEKFLQLKNIEAAKAEAEHNAQLAQTLEKKAEEGLELAKDEARQRRQDLMTIAHQLQGPLNPVIGAISLIKQIASARNLKEALERGEEGLLIDQIEEAMDDAQALTDDAVTLCYGIVTSFAREENRETALIKTSINAPEEMKKLCRRLQMTNAREDLTFVFHKEPDFPTLKMDRNLFTSVLYSLVHNAMKYARKGSEVRMECGFEYPGKKPVLKVETIGAHIYPREKELIFGQFKRGEAVEEGRHHRGVGLGLWIARILMRSIEGDLTVELTPSVPDLSVFLVHLPTTSL
jgi:signal transduction histidine kinase